MKTDMKSCKVIGPARTKAPDAEATAQGPTANPAASLKWVGEAEPSELFAFKECQELCRTRLTGPLLRLIAQLTGLRLRVLWHGPLGFQGPGAMPVLCPRARPRAGAEGRQPKRCEFCQQRRWKPALSPANRGGRFIGLCGVTSFCACLQLDKACPLTLVLQARITDHASRITHHAAHNIPRRLPSRGGSGASDPPRFGIHRPGWDGQDGIRQRLAEVEQHSNRGRAPARGTAPAIAWPPRIHGPTRFGKPRPEAR